MRDSLSNEKLEEISQQLPRIDDRFPFVTLQTPGIDLYDLTHNGRLGVGLVCLEDAGYRLQEMRLGLQEGYACLTWYREEAPHHL